MGDRELFELHPSTSAASAVPIVDTGPLGAAAERVVWARRLAFAAVYLIWGSTYLGIRIAVESIPPFLLAGSRSLLAGGLLFLWLRLRGARQPTLTEWTRASLAGVAMLAGGNGLVTWAETGVPSNLAALMLAGVPTYIVLMDWWRPGGVRPTRQAFVGVLLGVLGMALLVKPDPDALVQTHWLGVVALVLAGLCWAFGSLYSRYQTLYPNAAVSGAQQMIAGGAAMLLVAIGRGELTELSVADVSGRSFACFCYLTVFGSMLAFSAFNWLVGQTTPARLSTTAYVNPVVAVILGWIVLGESLNPISLVGAVLIICAVVVMVARFHTPQAKPPRPAAPR